MVPREATREAHGRRKNEAPRTTVVGARPRRDESLPRRIPRGLEVLVKKAAVDADFKKILLEQRAGAAEAIGLKLTAAEETMLASVPLPHLEGIIAHTNVTRGQRKVFLGYAAATMLAVLGPTTLECTTQSPDPVSPDAENKRTAAAAKKYRARYVNSPNTGSSRGITSAPRTAGITGILADKLSKGGDLDGIVSGIGGLGARPDIPPGVLRDRRNFNKVSGKLISVSAAAPSSVEGPAAHYPERSPSTIAAVVRRHLAGIHNAYKTALSKNPALGSGTIIARFTVLEGGAVENVTVERDTVGSAALAGSLISRLRSWRFPPVEEGDVTVVYPFVFIAKEG